MRECEYAPSTFTTALILHCLSYVSDAEVDELTTRALHFLEGEMESPGIWRFWSFRSTRRAMSPPDLDSTCCASFALRQYGRPVLSNRDFLLANTAPDGRFYTWLAPAGVDGAAMLMWSIWSAQWDDIDPVVNANAILYLGDSAETAAAVGYLMEAVRTSEADGFSRYYTTALALYYMVARAARLSAPSLGCLSETVVGRILARARCHDTMTSPLRVALMTATLHYLRESPRVLDRAVTWLLSAQAPDGSWPVEPLFKDPARFYGSAELTTAMCLQALAMHALAPY